MKRLLASLLLMCGVVSAQQTAGTTGMLDPSQIYSTGNLVQMTTTSTGSTWVNGVYQDQLTCWGWGMPGNCGPNPSVRPGGYINFSFGLTDLHQVQSIASVLPNSGTGLRVNGYNFGFTAKNGNGWDDGRVDTLSAYVSFYGTDGSIKDYTYYNLNSKFDWTQFNYTKDFVTPYATKDLSTVQYGFVGKDNNYWAGNYGPEIYNVNFSLKYSVDQCSVNVLSSPTCPGYTDALLRMLPPPGTSDPTTITGTTTTATGAVTTSVTADPVSPTVTVTSTPTVSSPTTGVASATTSTSTATATSAATPTALATKEGAPAQSSSGTNIGLSVVAKNKEREQAIVTQAVQTATSTAAAAAASSQQEALSVASQSSSNSITFATTTNPTATSAGTTSRTSSSGSTGLQLPGMSPDLLPAQPVQQSQMPAAVSVTASTVSVQDIKQLFSTTATSNATSISGGNVETVALAQPDFITNRTNPLTEIIEAKQTLPQAGVVQSIGSTVNRNVGDNEVAGGVSIARMAMAPVGYADYLNFTMRDAGFYAPKEVYKNQRNVDNARALRQLTNDARHRELVELQYAK